MLIGRSRSRCRTERTYPIEGNQLVDARSKQLLFNEFEVCTLGKSSLKDDEFFSDQTAYNLLEKHMKKKKTLGLMHFLVDRIRFGSKSGSGRGFSREYLNYREIKYFFRFSAQPTLFTLGVEDEQTGRRTYETFMCKTVRDMDPIHELIRRTTADPQFLLRSQIRTRRNVSLSSSDCSANHYEQDALHAPPIISVPSTEQTKTVYSMYEEPDSYCHYRADRNPIVPDRSPLLIERKKPDSSDVCYTSPRFPRRNSSSSRYQSNLEKGPVIVVKSHQSSPNMSHLSRSGPTTPNAYRSGYGGSGKGGTRYRSYHDLSAVQNGRLQQVNESKGTGTRTFDYCAPLSQTLSTASSRPELLDTTWKNTITYLSKNCNQEPEVSERGPVYMYVSRKKREESYQED